MRTLVAAFKILCFFAWSIILVPPQLLVMAFHRGRWAYEIPYLWERGTCFILRLKVIREGAPNTGQQTIYMANHISYLDIPVIAGILKASFVAKAEVASWPVFGFLSKLQQTAFIQRNRKDISVQRYALQNMLAAGKSLIIFPEGTSSDGTNVLPFKSSLFSIAYDENNAPRDLAVQPVSLSLESVNGHTVSTEADRDIYAWHGDMTLTPHLWQFAKSRGATVRVTFHKAYPARIYECRKLLAKKCQEDVLNGLQNIPCAA